jgi:hypothetical protein
MLIDAVDERAVKIEKQRGHVIDVSTHGMGAPETTGSLCFRSNSFSLATRKTVDRFPP